MKSLLEASTIGTVLFRGALLSATWWMLAGTGAWPFGAPVVLLALGASLLLTPPRATRLHPIALIRFAGFFLVRSVRAGFDVARRAFSPRLPLDPSILCFRLRLPPGPSRVLLANTLSLLPGTLSVDLDDDRLIAHVLDASLPIEQELRVAEAYIAAISGGAIDRV